MFSRLKNLVGICSFAFLALIFPVILAKSTICGFVSWQKAKNWVSTEGTIESSWLSLDGVYAKITYKFSVHGQSYLSNRIDVTDPADPLLGVTGHLYDKYPVGSKVTVFYDELQPGNSLLNREFKGEIWVSFAYFVMSLAFSGTMAYLAMTSKSRRSKKVLSRMMKRYEKRQKERVLRALREKSARTT